MISSQLFLFLLTGFTEDMEEEPVAMDRDFLSADWLQELPEDLDMYIAQRNFEGAVDLVEKGNIILMIFFALFFHCQFFSILIYQVLNNHNMKSSA